jgi:hypothetical protein
MANANKIDRDKKAAGRLNYLRNAKFELVGFKSNEPVPSISEARKMIGENKRRIAAQKPQPIVRG